MLTYVLAFVVGLASLGLYATTFALPEVSRKNDLIWSGVGLFYALVLWVCAGRITGGVLLGQLASTALIGWLGWQTLEGRWNETPENERVNAGKVAGVRSKISGLATKVQDLSASVSSSSSESSQDPVETIEEEPPLTVEDFGNPPKVEVPEAVKPTLKSFNNPDAGKRFGGLLNNAKSMFGDLNKPKNKEIYVRKNFKDDATEAVTGAAAIVGSAIERVVDDDFDFSDVMENTGVADGVANAVEKVTDVVDTIAETVTEAVSEAVSEPVSELVSEAAKPSLTNIQTEMVAVVENASEAIETKSAEVLDEFGDRINP